MEEMGEKYIYGVDRSLGSSRVDYTMDEWNHFMTALDGDPYHSPQLARYVDELPPFDVTITFANEYGQMAVMRIFGVEILNEGSGMSIDDVVTERAMTYIARRIEHIKRID